MEKSSRMAGWRGRMFGPASELPYRRRTSDRIRVVVAFVLMASVIAYEGEASPSENNHQARICTRITPGRQRVNLDY